MAPLRVVVLADTHVRDGPGRADLPGRAWAYLRRCDLILHAGDVVEGGLLARLSELAPTYAVLGNNDAALEGTLPGTTELQLAGVRVAMLHDAGARRGRAPRLHRRFPDADLVVFGHSHVPCDEVGESGQVLLNPGSPTQRRAQPQRTLGLLALGDGVLVGRRVVALDG